MNTHRLHSIAAAALLPVLALAGTASAHPAEPTVPLDDVPAMVAATNEAGFALQGSLAASGDNPVLSPASLLVAFGMAGLGASDEATAQRLIDVFGLPAGDDLGPAMQALLERLTPNGAGDAPSTLDLANAVFTQDGLAVNPDYLAAVEQFFAGDVSSLDFEGDLAGAVQAINEYIADHTAGRITDLVSEATLGEDTRVALVNALYFQSGWASAFDSTTDEEFTLADGSIVQVPTMHLSGDVAYAEGPAETVVALPYQDHYEMVVVMPDDSAGLDDLVAGLDAASWDTLVGSTSTGLVELSLPSWDVDTQGDLAPALVELGIEIPGGNYDGIAEAAEIGSVIHGAQLTVDENGTEGAAATVIGMPAGAAPGQDPPQPKPIEIDQPFYYAVRDTTTGLILFSGQIDDPSSALVTS